MSQSPEAQRNLAEAERVRHQARRAAGIVGDFIDIGARLRGLFGD